MNPIQGNKLQIVLFEGMANAVMHAANGWLEHRGMMVEVVDIGFNYQGPEYDGKKKLTDCGTHGVLIAYRDLTINEARERQGCAPLRPPATDEQRQAELKEMRHGLD